MLSQQDFFERYRQLDTENLLQHLVLHDLGGEAREEGASSTRPWQGVDGDAVASDGRVPNRIVRVRTRHGDGSSSSGEAQ